MGRRVLVLQIFCRLHSQIERAREVVLSSHELTPGDGRKKAQTWEECKIICAEVDNENKYMDCTKVKAFLDTIAEGKGEQEKKAAGKKAAAKSKLKATPASWRFGRCGCQVALCL